MNKAKIRLSAIEMELVQNSSWILTKRGIIDKVYQIFGWLATDFEVNLRRNKDQLPNEILTIAPKISKGENYHELPYVVLDFPRLYDKENSVAVRNFFWWGNYFSSHLYLKGIYKEQWQTKIIECYPFLSSNEYYVCINNTEWDFRFEQNNFKAVRDLQQDELKSIVESHPFIKLARFISLEKWDRVPAFLTDSFNKHLKLVGINFQDGETDL